MRPLTLRNYKRNGLFLRGTLCATGSADFPDMAHILPAAHRLPPVAEALRVLVYSTDGTRSAWLDRELDTSGIIVQRGRSIAELVAALVEDPPPRPQAFVADFDLITTPELQVLHAIRQQGWFGTIFALGKVSMALRRSLQIERVFAAPLPIHGLRAALAGLSHDARTMRLARVVSG
jgi:hypothetical protein